ncbi:MAG: hypothetical protein AAF604_02955 [Acidobacteriota bacterium]
MAEPAPAEVESRLGLRVAGLSCGRCGGALEVETGVRVVECPFCGMRSLAVGDRGLRRFAVEPRVDANAARQALRRWLKAGWNKHSALDREAEIGEAFLCFLPFFRVQADAVGYAFGTVRKRRTSNGKTRTVEVDVERPVERHLDRTFAAVNVAEWGVQRVDLTGDPLVPFDGAALERRGMVFTPTVSETAVREAALADFAAASDPASGMHKVRFRFLDTLRERMSTIHYPLWVIRYRFRGRSYQAVIDGEDGTLAYGKAPGNDLYRALTLVGSQAAACFAGTTALQSEAGIWSLVVGGVFFFGIFAWGWRRFRYGAVVEEGSGKVSTRRRRRSRR